MSLEENVAPKCGLHGLHCAEMAPSPLHVCLLAPEDPWPGHLSRGCFAEEVPQRRGSFEGSLFASVLRQREDFLFPLFLKGCGLRVPTSLAVGVEGFPSAGRCGLTEISD